MREENSVVGPRIVCVGSNKESRIALSGLIALPANVVALVTRPASNSGNVCDYVDLHDDCMRAGIATIDTTDINSRDTLAGIRSFRPDYIYTLGWSQLFGQELLKIPRKYVVGSHPTPLPLGRGRAPVPWTVLERHTQSAVSLFEMNSGVDAGKILLQRWFDIPPQPYAADVYQLVAGALCDAFVELASAHSEGRTLEPIPQNAAAATYRAKRSPGDGHIDFYAGAADVECLVRAVSAPYPGAYTYYYDRKLVVWRADCRDVPDHMGVPGQILRRNAGRLLVHAGDSPLWLSDFSCDGHPVDATELKIGSKLGYALEDEVFRLKLQISQLRAMLADREAALAKGKVA